KGSSCSARRAPSTPSNSTNSSTPSRAWTWMRSARRSPNSRKRKTSGLPLGNSADPLGRGEFGLHQVLRPSFFFLSHRSGNRVVARSEVLLHRLDDCGAFHTRLPAHRIHSLLYRGRALIGEFLLADA